MKNRSIKTISTIAVIVLGIANIAVVSSISRWTLKNSIESERSAQARIILSSAAKTMTERLTASEDLVLRCAVGTDLTEQSPRADERRTILRNQMLRYEEIYTLIYAKDSGEYFSFLNHPLLTSYDPRTRDWYNETQNLTWSEPFLAYTNQNIVFSVSAPIRASNEKRKGVVTIVFDVVGFSRYLDAEELDDGDHLFLLSPEGRVLASNDESRLGSEIFFTAVASGQIDTEEFSFHLGKDEYDFYTAKIGKTGLRILSGINTRNIRRRLNRTFLAVFAVQFGLLAFLAFVIYILVRKGVHPLEKLTDLMSQAETGDYSVRASLEQYKEIGILSRQFNRMLVGIQTRDEILKHREIKIKNLAFYDPLTGLPNRTFLMKTLNSLINGEKTPEDRNGGTGGALLYLDLDGFKTVNDTAGHSVGDLVLQEVAHRISRNLRDGQTAARIGGDEFVVILEGLESVEVIRRAASRILDSLNQPIETNGTKYEIGASIGVVIFPTQGTESETLLKKADLAMYKAKKNGKNTFQIFEENLEEEIIVRNILETEIRRSFREGEFNFAYQPQWDLKTGAIVGFEALLRTENPDLEAFPTQEIITAAEETGMISAIERDAYAECFAFLVKLNDEFDDSLHLSVNLSSSHLMQPDFTDSFLKIVKDSGANPHRINVEITESIMMKSMKAGKEKLGILKEHGIRIHLDDFGTGYSSLSYLRNLPIHCVKMDRTFLETIEEDEKNRSIVALMVEMAHSLDNQIIAEGIETERQQELIASMGFDWGQGFLVGRHMTKDTVLAFLKNRFQTTDSRQKTTEE